MSAFRWVTSEDERRSDSEGPGVLVRVAAADDGGAVALGLDLDPGGEPAPVIVVNLRGGKSWRVEPSRIGPHARYDLVFPAPGAGAGGSGGESEVIADLEGPGVPPCRVVVRRTRCSIVSAVVERGDRSSPTTSLAEAEAEAALRWQGWGRASELVVLKQFETGRGGSAVTVVRPRLRAPRSDRPTLESSGPPEVADGAPGSCWLVKSGEVRKVRREWDRFREFLVDRSHPYLARCESYLAVRPPGSTAPPETTTLTSTFVGGGELIRPEPLDEVLRGPVAPGRVEQLIDRVFAVLGPWSQAARPHPLGRWRRVFRGNENDWLLFGKFDLSLRQKAGPKGPLGRLEFTAALDWDVSFKEKEHLHTHLLGRKGDGLLHRLREIEAAFSITHGDLNPRNVLCDGDDVWLIDFEHVGVAPTLVDHARLEANLRLWCLRLGPTDANVEDVAAALETRLLDHFLGNSGGLGVVSELAGALDADARNLLNVAQAIARIRSHAARLCLARYPDRRDYLAVLYLTVLSLLQYASTAAAPPQNYRLLMGLAWVLEDTLSRILGRAPFPRRRVPLDPKCLITAPWLLPPRAPGRVRYVLDREDGRRALPHLAATKGVLQSQVHHLDVFDHTLLVLAYVEALIDPEDGDPLSGFLDPSGLDERVAATLRAQAIRLPGVPAPQARPAPPDLSDLGPLLDDARASLREALADPDAVALLKWTALLHDVGKPGTRGMNIEKSPPQVLFHRHEHYGLQLLEATLAHLFPDDRLRARIRRMIVEHHLHHQLGDHYRSAAGEGKPSRLAVLRAELEAGEVGEAEFERLAKHLVETPEQSPIDFALLILHGYADSMACRGPEAKAPAGEVARVDLVLLAFAGARDRLAEIRDRRTSKTATLREASERLRLEHGLDPASWGPVWRRLTPMLGPWYDRHAGQALPTLDEVLARARELLQPSRDPKR